MITILTPTYNRAYILNQAYESLCSQTCNDFEWIIVDDGSKDDTDILVKNWLSSDKKIDLKYYKKENGGKHKAVNYGVKKAKYDYIMILDSDDYLTNNAVELAIKWIDTIKENNEFAGVAGLRGWKTREGAIGGNTENEGFIDATNLERRKKKLMGDKVEIYKKSIMNKYPFPEFEGENFLRESASWDKIALDGYKIRWFNKIIYKCDYLEDGLTKNVNYEVYAKNFQGYLYCTLLHLETDPPIYNLLTIGEFSKVAELKKMTTSEICDALKINVIKLNISQMVYKLNLLRHGLK